MSSKSGFEIPGVILSEPTLLNSPPLGARVNSRDSRCFCLYFVSCPWCYVIISVIAGIKFRFVSPFDVKCPFTFP